ncbi:MAG TPA: hypothetical protein VJT84_06340 [Gaiellaceae bacterium]|nr:hypothetical protein [Gaiellaceae bacterium]
MKRRLLAVGALLAVPVIVAAVYGGSTKPSAKAQALQLRHELMLRANSSEEELEPRLAGPIRKARPSHIKFKEGIKVAAARTAGTALTFGQPTISGIQGNGFEVDIRVDPTDGDRIYMSAPASLSSNTSFIWRSLDGDTFKWIPAATPLAGKVNACAGGGDTELDVDTAGHLYFNDLTLANFSTARSDDRGVSFTAQCNNLAVPDAVVDRQWYAHDGDPTSGGTLYLVNDEIGPGGVDCGSSGAPNNVLVMYRSPLPGAPGATAGIQFGPAKKVTAAGSCDEGIMGNNEVSPVATKTGLAGGTLATAVRHIYVAHDNAELNKILIGRCFPVDVTTDPSGLSCEDLPIADLGANTRTGGDFPVLAIDKAGNLYVAWEQADVDNNGVAGDTSLYYAFSTNEGNTWSNPIKVPTGTANNVFASIAAGDDGLVDISWVGTDAHVDPNDTTCTQGGPDAVHGLWSLYVTQTRNGHSASGVAFTPAALAGQHYMHKGTIQTLIGHQCGDRTLGDFFQMRIGPDGGASLSFADSNNIDEAFAPHAMFVRQNGGLGVYKRKSVRVEKLLLNKAPDRAGDGVFEAAGQTSASSPNLDILISQFSKPALSDCHPAGTPCYRIKMTVSNLSLNPPAAPNTDTDLVWLTQWLTPASPGCTNTASDSGCATGGKNFMVYAESTGGGAIRCWSGENAAIAQGGGVSLTYPGTNEITAPGACNAVMGPKGYISIDVPKAAVSLEAGTNPLDKFLYSITASTMTLPQPANTVPPFAGLGGSLFNLIDVVQAYNSQS